MSLYTKVGKDMTWPNPASDRAHEIEYRLRHDTASRIDMLAAASLIAAFRQMVLDTREKRQQVVGALRRDAK